MNDLYDNLEMIVKTKETDFIKIFSEAMDGSFNLTDYQNREYSIISGKNKRIKFQDENKKSGIWNDY